MAFLSRSKKATCSFFSTSKGKIHILYHAKPLKVADIATLMENKQGLLRISLKIDG